MLYIHIITLTALDTMFEKAELSSNQKLELLGRIGFYLKKLHRDIDSYGYFKDKNLLKKIFTPKGIYVFDNFAETFHKVYDKYYNITKKFQYSNQTYNFNLHRFLEKNSNLF
jgi:hypothetical protein